MLAARGMTPDRVAHRAFIVCRSAFVAVTLRLSTERLPGHIKRGVVPPERLIGELRYAKAVYDRQVVSPAGVYERSGRSFVVAVREESSGIG